MQLSEYLRLNRGKASMLAEALGVSPSYLSQMASGHRPIQPRFCPIVERVTEGSVRCEEMRSDIDWDYVRQSPSDT